LRWLPDSENSRVKESDEDQLLSRLYFENQSCGAVHSLTADDLIHQVGPVRNLVRAKEQGADKLVTLCSMCYNTLARANQIMKNDEVKRDTINRFMDEEID
jgi:heterodisulfide reductase subunit B